GTTFSGIHGDVQVVGITVIDDTGNSTYCSTTVTISDDEKPVFVNCPAVINLNNDVDQCGANVFFTPPGATDNCFGQIVITQTSGTVPGTYVAVNTPQPVSFRAQDIAGNTESCQTTIVVNDVQSPVLVCPAGVQDFDASASCNYTGTLPLNASATDNCGIATLSNNLNSTNSVVGYVFPLGNTVVVWTATDIYSNTQTCSYTVQITDHTAPVISVCPPDRVINTSSNGTGDCTGPVSNLLSELVVTDNCTSDGNLVKIQTPVSGSTFGTAHNDIQVIQYSVTDEAGNTSSCSTQLTLNDDENPVLTNCPPNLTASTTDQYPCYATRAWTHPGASDNCGISLLNFRILNPNNAVYGPVDIDPLNASYSFEVGNSVVTYQVADQKGNTATCSFSVTVTTVKSLVGNKVWHDQNGSGVQDAGEPGISGVLVTLSGTRLCDAALVSQTVTSDVAGNYLFTSVEPGTYGITFGIPAGYIPTAPGKGSDELLDSDFGSMGMTDPFNVLVADTILSLDAGFYIPGRIGDLVWDDLNGNGLQDAGEPGIAGAVVLLTGTSGDGAPVSMSTTTDASGYFVFGSTASGSTVLVPGSYQISFVTPSGGYVRTNANDPDGMDANDSDADPGTGAAVFEVISSGEYNTTYDAGFYRPASIGDYAWVDSNANGTQDSGESPLGNVPIFLNGTDGQGNTVSRSTQTNIDGSYSFANLLPGNYRLTFSEFSSNGQKYILAPNDRGGNDNSDSDPNRLQGGQTVVETLVSGELNTSYDGGYFSPVSVGNLVWLDRNANGVQDAGEPGIPGIVVKLLDAAGLPVTTNAEGASVTDQVTDANGNYQFTNLIPGSYRVRFTNPDV
ncbi:MAG: SdrD B-like domain-containing protein, partial [Bacteroidota bacterium]